MANVDEGDRRGNIVVLSEEKRTQLFITVVGVLLAGFISVLWSMFSDIDDGLGKLEVEVSGYSHTLIKIQEHVFNHDKEQDIWVNRILSNVDAIDALRNKVSARKDPFSGTEGRELDHRIRALELCCGVLRIDNSNGLSNITDE